MESDRFLGALLADHLADGKPDDREERDGGNAAQEPDIPDVFCGKEDERINFFQDVFSDRFREHFQNGPSGHPGMNGDA